MSIHKAVVTVEFPRPIKGSELIGGVKALIGKGNRYAPSFISEQRFDNGDVFIIGQFSQYPYDQILVASTRESADIRPDETYRKVEVMDTSWSGSVFCVGYDDDAPVAAVRRFAEKLKQHFSDPVNNSVASIWPQEIKVCAICERIVRPGIFAGVSYCSTDGENPPTRIVKVAKVEG